MTVVHLPRPILCPLKLNPRRRHYLIQGALATAALALIFYIENSLTRAAILAAVGSTTFTIFVMPHGRMSQTRRVIGAHLIGVGVGAAFSQMATLPGVVAVAASTHLVIDLIAAGSVGLTMVLMVAMGMEHPPAAGTALGLVVHSWSYGTIVFILAAVIVLCLIRDILTQHLRDLV